MIVLRFQNNWRHAVKRSTFVAPTSLQQLHRHVKFSSTSSSSSSSSSSDHKEEASSSSSSSSTTTCDVVQGPSLLRTQVHRPSPSLMFLPGLRSLPFWTSIDKESGINRVAYQDPTVSHIVQYLQDNVDIIQKEYNSVAHKLLSDYEATDHQKLHQGKWEWHSYLNKGSVRGHFAYHFPNTAKILQELRNDHLLFEGTPFGFAFFSTLHGNSKIQAHTSPINMRLRIHLPLLVPKSDETTELIQCGIRVGSVAQEWTPGKALVLDDSYDHEVWNDTNEIRVLLLIDIWHPDVTMTERKEIVEMFQHAKQQGWWKK